MNEFSRLPFRLVWYWMGLGAISWVFVSLFTFLMVYVLAQLEVYVKFTTQDFPLLFFIWIIISIFVFLFNFPILIWRWKRFAYRFDHNKIVIRVSGNDMLIPLSQVREAEIFEDFVGKMLGLKSIFFKLKDPPPEVAEFRFWLLPIRPYWSPLFPKPFGRRWWRYYAANTIYMWIAEKEKADETLRLLTARI